MYRTSHDGTDEGGLVGDGVARSRHDITDGDDTDDRANTSAECKEDEDDHTNSLSQSSEAHFICDSCLLDTFSYCVCVCT